MPNTIKGLPVYDAVTALEITVTAADVREGKKKNAHSCAAARAICREAKAEQAIVHLSRAYVRQANSWLRYSVSNNVRSEILAFDRGGEFAPGDYTFLPIQKHQQQGKRRMRNTGNGTPKPQAAKRTKRPYHTTTNVRNSMEFDK